MSGAASALLPGRLGAIRSPLRALQAKGRARTPIAVTSSGWRRTSGRSTGRRRQSLAQPTITLARPTDSSGEDGVRPRTPRRRTRWCGRRGRGTRAGRRPLAQIPRGQGRNAEWVDRSARRAGDRSAPPPSLEVGVGQGGGGGVGPRVGAGWRRGWGRRWAQGGGRVGGKARSNGGGPDRGSEGTHSRRIRERWTRSHRRADPARPAPGRPRQRPDRGRGQPGGRIKTGGSGRLPGLCLAESPSTRPPGGRAEAAGSVRLARSALLRVQRAAHRRAPSVPEDGSVRRSGLESFPQPSPTCNRPGTRSGPHRD